MNLEEIYCHNCGKYVRFKVDETLNGNHVFNCPNCGHEHCRVVINGQITGDRWNSRNITYYPTSVSSSDYSIYANASSDAGTYYLRGAWVDAGI